MYNNTAGIDPVHTGVEQIQIRSRITSTDKVLFVPAPIFWPIGPSAVVVTLSR